MDLGEAVDNWFTLSAWGWWGNGRWWTIS